MSQSVIFKACQEETNPPIHGRKYILISLMHLDEAILVNVLQGDIFVMNENQKINGRMNTLQEQTVYN